MSLARDHALLELDSRQLPAWPPRSLPAKALHAMQSTGRPLDPRDRALSEQIVTGVIKNLLHLQFFISRYSGRSLKSIDPLVQKILAIAIYQLRFLTRIPPSAAVDEAVEQAKRFGQGKAAGFVNAVLRKAAANPPVPLPDRAADPARYAEVVLSHPRELFDRLVALLGMDDALRFCEHDNRQPPTIVRLLPGAAPADLQEPGITIQPHEQPGLFVVDPAKREILARWAEEGTAQVQDPTAALAVEQLDLAPGQMVLDRCCGLGTKTLQLRQHLGDQGLILAMDPSAARHEGLVHLLEKRGIANIHVRQVGMMDELPPEDPRTFDRILIDAPCSNSGVLARRAEARYAQVRQNLRSLARLQDRILADSAPRLQPGGILVYSTCSVWPEENQGRIEPFLQAHPDYQLLRQQTTLPSFDPAPTRYRDGGYYAVLRRQS